MVAAVVALGLLYLLYRGFTLDLTFHKYQKFTLILLLCSGISVIIIIGVTAVEPLTLFGYTGTWLGMVGMTLVFYVVSSGISALFPRHRQTIVFAALVILILVTAYSIFNGTRLPSVKEITIPNTKLPETLSGFTIVQLSDLHLGAIATPKWLRHTVEKVNHLKPDLIVITGDLMEGYKTIKSWKPYIEELKYLKSRYGVMAVTGNHDVVHGGAEFFKLARESGITVLNNQTVTVAGCIQVAGINDRLGRNYELEGPDLAKALEHIDPSLPVVLLSHRPEYFEAAKIYGIDLQLSGHTHAGQIPPGDLFVRLFYQHPYGLYFEEGSYIYTSSGTCVMEVPMRLFSRNEIVRIRLVRKKT
jgi:predicted MPP superfamily phosphohydrolase